MKPRNLLIVLSVSLSFVSCAYIDPLIEDANIVSVADEVQISKQMQGEVAKAMKIIEDPKLTTPVRQIGNRLVAALPHKDFDYQFFVVADNSPNAFTIPGAKIYVHTGLMQFVSDENELAGVMAHEIGHAYERHPAKSITRQAGLSQLVSRVGGTNAGAKTRLGLVDSMRMRQDLHFIPNLTIEPVPYGAGDGGALSAEQVRRWASNLRRDR